MKPQTRRSFIKTGAAVAPFFVVPGHVVGQGPGKSPNGKLRMAAIGAGGKGASDIGPHQGKEDIVALCDVDLQGRAGGTVKKSPEAKLYTDYRKMFDEMGDQIDAVTVSTPDHTHFPAALMAIQHGKHVYVQKPLTHTVWEARQLLIAAREKGVVTNMGNQGHALNGCRELREMVLSGFLGTIDRVEVFTNRPVWPQWPKVKGRLPKQDIPEGLDWDAFLGTAPERDYNKGYQPFNWRGWWDYGCGALGDMACHIMDGPYYALGLTAPESVEAIEVDGGNDEVFPGGCVVEYKFPARGAHPGVSLKWYDGSRRPERPEKLDADRNWDKIKGGFILHGSENSVLCTDDYCRGPRVIPADKFKEFMADKPDAVIPRVPDQNPYYEWTRAIRGEGPVPGSNFEYSAPFTEVVNLGNVALKAGRKIRWDSGNMECIGDQEATKHVSKTYRKEWAPKLDGIQVG